jgi:medium-chain acyl-[acyl-carrier-protein] hydrolase
MHIESDAMFIERLRQFNGTAEAILNNTELMRLFLPTLRADFRLNEAYAYVAEPPLDCPIAVFGGADDRIVPFGQMAGWRQQTAGRYTQRSLPGGHFFVQTAQQHLCRLIADELELGVAATLSHTGASD